MLLIYRYLINIFFPLIIIITFFRTWFNKEDKNRFKEKLFSSSFNIIKNHNKKLIWFHAASIGELKSIISLIKRLNEKNQFEFLITTVTLSSSYLISKELLNEKNITHRFFPIDKLSLVKKFLDNWSPDLIIFVDSEIWPNFILEIKKKDIPLVLLNARITRKTFLKWNLIPKVAEKVFQSFALCLPASNESKKYLEKFKVKNIKYFGNLKLASENKIHILNDVNKEILNISKFWCAVSTHKEEDIFCLKTHLKIKAIHKDIITIIIPRHIDRVQNIKVSCKQLNLNCQILSGDELIKNGKEIIIINSYGMTSNYLELCKSVFIGKSMMEKLKNVGGQNPIEAAKLKCKIYHGPYVYNFQEIYDLFNKHKISEKIHNEDELANKISMDLSQSSEITNEKIEIINNLGKKILNDTCNELDKIINK
jgi:3-deoxy-D-manno-octulosonic-acid transferase